MKKVFVYLLMLTLAVSQAIGAPSKQDDKLTEYYIKEMGGWVVRGFSGKTPFCGIGTYNDLGNVVIIYHLSDDTVTMTIKWSKWELGTSPTNDVVGFRFIAGEKNEITYLQYLTFSNSKPDEIYGDKIPPEFMRKFAQYNVVEVLMPGSLPSVRIGLDDSDKAVLAWRECIESYNKKGK